MRARSSCSRRAALALLLGLAASACTTTAPTQPWEDRLRGPAVVLLGEVHDNAEHHRLRLALLRRAVAAGWRPAIAMEQFDRERQADIDAARRERPHDADHLIAHATPPGERGWNWDFYRPLIAVALDHDLPLIAANLSTTDATRIVRRGYGAVFDASSMATLGLDAPIASDWQAAQEREIDAGHCHQLPPTLWPAMARAQFARDAVMGALLRQHAGHGVVLIAGNGHVRRDIGVPRWLGDSTPTFAVGYLEAEPGPDAMRLFDAVVVTAPAPRSDPCVDFGKRRRAGLN